MVIVFIILPLEIIAYPTNGIRLNEWNIYQHGIGTIDINRGLSNLYRCEIHLYSNGDAVISFQGNGLWTFSGVWQYASKNTVFIRINYFNGARVRNGNATAVLTKTSFSRVYLSGRTENAVFNVQFTPLYQNCFRCNDNGNSSSLAQLQQIQNGNGINAYLGVNNQVTSVSVNLSISRRGTIKTYGAVNSTITGDWTSPNSSLVRFYVKKH